MHIKSLNTFCTKFGIVAMVTSLNFENLKKIKKYFFSFYIFWLSHFKLLIHKSVKDLSAAIFLDTPSNMT